MVDRVSTKLFVKGPRLKQTWVRSHIAKESTCPTPGAVNEVKALGLPVVTMLRRVWAEVARDS